MVDSGSDLTDVYWQPVGLDGGESRSPERIDSGCGCFASADFLGRMGVLCNTVAD